MPRHRLRALGLATMAVLGLTVFGTAGAQAALMLRHTAILLNGEVLGVTQSKQLTGEQEGTAIFKIPAKNTEIRCKKGALSKAPNPNLSMAKNVTDFKENPGGFELPEKSESGLAAVGEGAIEFSECAVFFGGTESAPCTKAFNEHNKNIAGSAGHPTANFLALTLLFFKEVGNLTTHVLLVRVVAPLISGLFTTLEFGGTCSLPEKAKITGSIAGEVSFPMPYVDGKKITVKFESESTFGKELNSTVESQLFFGASSAYMEGKGFAELSGALGTEKWGVM